MSTPVLVSPHADAPVRSYSMQAPNIPETAKVARDMLTGLLTVTGHTPLVELARLLVSEVVSNVHLHTKVSRLTLEATVQADRLRVSVRDDDPCGMPRPQAAQGDGMAPEFAPETAEHGRGLLLVQACADDWGTMWHGGRPPTGKSVWFQLVDRGGR
ncbi:ATP-binding protein [Streptomyces sp. S07_1.15]|uniref:ATP-binding protein n=1 Tax=Streptomyces sp. S07_1.15 TaxID=2873925 RepID=UPI001D15A9B9|nr:ATP-binding protein [Streptomyces sp. S07_1.15]MCC3653870.1 ATP-binding protein [Streptomyces sp. S07_1.15]